jgi:carbonic anhydrase
MGRRLAVVAAGLLTAALVTSCRDPMEPNVEPNVQTSFSPRVARPELHNHDYIHPLASVIGAVDLGDDVFVAPGASIRADEGQPIHVGSGSNVQDGVVIHALETFEDGRIIEANLVHVGGRAYAVYIGESVSLAHQAQVHGPAAVGKGTFDGMQALVFRAEVGDSCVLEPRALVMGVEIAPGRYVPAGAVIRTQAEALPEIDESYSFAHINEEVLHVNHELAAGYQRRGR